MKAYWHIHHDRLLEFSDDIQERIDYIKQHKPAGEIKLRLRLLRPVQGQLPDAVLRTGTAYDKARAAYYKAGTACDKAWTACSKARAACSKARAAYDKAWTACDKAWTACSKARAAYCEARDTHASEIEALHAKECPNCPWNGSSIF